MQIKIIVRYISDLSDWQNLGSLIIASSGKNMEQGEPSHTDGEFYWCNHGEKVWKQPVKLTMHMPCGYSNFIPRCEF